MEKRSAYVGRKKPWCVRLITREQVPRLSYYHIEIRKSIGKVDRETYMQELPKAGDELAWSHKVSVRFYELFRGEG